MKRFFANTTALLSLLALVGVAHAGGKVGIDPTSKKKSTAQATQAGKRLAPQAAKTEPQKKKAKASSSTTTKPRQGLQDNGRDAQGVEQGVLVAQAQQPPKKGQGAERKTQAPARGGYDIKKGGAAAKKNPKTSSPAGSQRGRQGVDAQGTEAQGVGHE